jgi:hypothetical protein
MLADKELLESLLMFIGKRLRHEVEGLLIGGNAMLYYGLKGQTKDLDIVLFHRKDIAGISRIILSHPMYRTAKVMKIPYEIKPELRKKGEPTVIGNKDLPRFDLFYRHVFSVDTKRMFNESKRSIRFELIKLKLVDSENLIFLKAVTGRPVDIDDIIRVVKNMQIDWNAELRIIKKFFKTDRKLVWFALGSFYDINKKEK